MERKLIDYLPYGVRDYAELAGLLAAEEPELAAAWTAAEELLREQFLPTAEGLGLRRAEELLGAQGLGGEGVEERRGYLLARWNEFLPFTLPRLREMLAALCGAGACGVVLTGFSLRVEVPLGAKGRFSAVVELLERVTPQNLRLTVVQCYAPHGELCRLTHGALAGFTHETIRNEVLKNGNENGTFLLGKAV